MFRALDGGKILESLKTTSRGGGGWGEEKKCSGKKQIQSNY